MVVGAARRSRIEQLRRRKIPGYRWERHRLSWAVWRAARDEAVERARREHYERRVRAYRIAPYPFPFQEDGPIAYATA